MEERTLTDADITAIVSAMSCANPCPNGLTAADTIVLKDLAGWLCSAKNIIGKAVVYGFLAAIVGLAMLGIGKFGGGK